MNSWYLHGPVRVHSPQEWAGTGRPSHPEELTDREQRGVGGGGARWPGAWGALRATGGSGPSLEVGANAPTLPQKAFPESVNSIPMRETVRESGGNDAGRAKVSGVREPKPPAQPLSERREEGGGALRSSSHG